MISEIITWILDHVKPALKSAAVSLLENRPVAFVTASILLVVAGILGYQSWQRADFYQRTVEKALAKRTENTPQTYKALEALMMSNAETNSDGTEFSFRQTVGQARFSANFADSLKEIDAVLGSSNAATPTATLDIAKPDVAALMPKRQEEAIITETSGLGFLFLPVRLLRLSDEDFAEISNQPTSIAKNVGISERNGSQSCDPKALICDDVLTTRRLLIAMKKATTALITDDKLPEGVELKPTQAYYITENGLNRIVSREGNDQIFYRNQFRAATVFPARPYYIGALGKLTDAPGPLLGQKEERPQGKLNDYFYVSEPYLDIGGNGVVITLARAVRYPNHSEAVLCFDLRLDGEHALGKKFEDLLDRLKAAHVHLTCTTIGSGDPMCIPDNRPDDELIDAAPALAQMLKDAKQMGNRSGVLGGFAFVPMKAESGVTAAVSMQTPLSQILHTNHELRFMVPLEPPKVLDVEKQVVALRFLAVSLNVGHFLQNTAAMGFVALILVTSGICILLVSWAGDARKRAFVENEKRHLHLALDRVSTVMLSSNTPYVRLDDQDRILNANQSLAAFLAVPTDSVSMTRELIGTRFEDWVSGEVSMRRYHATQERRRKGEPVDPYSLQFKRLDGQLVDGKIVSSVVPASQDRKGALPETFGILVPL
jgi:PAS domain-containing protein